VADAEAESRVDVDEERTTALELFFDLVFVYAITQTSHLVSADLTPEGFARGAVVLATVWYAWICFAWLTNNVGVDDELVRAGVVAAAGASFLVALAVPHALGSEVLLFVSAYFVVRLLHVVLYTYGTRDAPAVRRNVLAIAPTYVFLRLPLHPAQGLPELLRLDRAEGPRIDIEEVVDLAGRDHEFADRNTATGAEVDVLLVLYHPAGVTKHLVDDDTRLLLRLEIEIRHSRPRLGRVGESEEAPFAVNARSAAGIRVGSLIRL
jgi:hypothetical protein